MVDFPNGTPELPDIEPLDSPGSAANIGIRELINRANDNILGLVDRAYNGPEGVNPIINGGPLIWPDALSYTSMASLAYGPDQWRWHQSGGGVVDWALSTDTPTPNNNTQKIPYSLGVTVTTPDVTIGSTDYYFVEHVMEGFNWAQLAQRAFTIRFWIRSPVVGRHYVAFVNTAGDQSYLASYDIAVANTWEEKSLPVPASPSAGTWDYQTGTGLRIRFALAVGSVLQGSAGSWVATNLAAASDQVNVMGTAANVFRICGLSAKAGPYCPPYLQRPYALEEMLCKRYYEVLANGASSMLGSGFALSATQVEFMCPMQFKRVVPTISVDTIANLKVYSGAGTINCTALSVIGTGRILPLLRATVAGGLTAGQAALVMGQTAVVKINARLP